MVAISGSSFNVFPVMRSCPGIFFRFTFSLKTRATCLAINEMFPFGVAIDNFGSLDFICGEWERNAFSRCFENSTPLSASRFAQLSSADLGDDLN